MAKICSIQRVELDLNFEDHLEGIVMETDHGPVHFMISNWRECCETWGVSINGSVVTKSFKNTKKQKQKVFRKRVRRRLRAHFLHESISSVQFNAAREKYQRHRMERGVVCLDVCMSNGRTHHIDVWCNHNGWYAHTAVLEWPGHERETIILNLDPFLS